MSWTAVDLPAAVRLCIAALLVVFNVSALREQALLRGPGAIRSIAWDESGRFEIWTRSHPAMPAVLRAASFRLGRGWFVLSFTSAAGVRGVVIDGAHQDPVAFRRLGRHLARGMLIPSAPKV